MGSLSNEDKGQNNTFKRFKDRYEFPELKNEWLTKSIYTGRPDMVVVEAKASGYL